MDNVNYVDLFKTDAISSNSEMKMVVAMARLMQKRGYTLSIEGVAADLSVLNSTTRQFFEYAVSQEVLQTSWKPEATYVQRSDLWFDLDWLDKWDELVPYQEAEGYRLWEFPEMKTTLWGTEWRDRVLGRSISSTFLYVYAEHLCRTLLDGSDDQVVFRFSEMEAKEPQNFIVAITSAKLNPRLGQQSVLDINMSEAELDYLKFMHSSQDQGHRRKYTVDEKKEIAQSLGFIPGRVCVKWSRRGVIEGRSNGRIDSRTLVIYRGIEESTNGRPRVKYTTISEPMTVEEKEIEFEDVTDEHKYLYRDILNKPLHTYDQTDDLFNVAFGNYLLDETEMFLPLERGESVTKYVTVPNESGDPQLVTFEMSAEDAIYWVLKQRQVDFDADLYISDNFPEGVDPMYHVYSYEINGQRK